MFVCVLSWLLACVSYVSYVFRAAFVPCSCRCVVDFSLAQEKVKAHTGASGMVGTAVYLAPEKVMCEVYGTAVDWWSLGILIFEMLTGNVCPTMLLPLRIVLLNVCVGIAMCVCSGSAMVPAERT